MTRISSIYAESSAYVPEKTRARAGKAPSSIIYPRGLESLSLSLSLSFSLRIWIEEWVERVNGGYRSISNRKWVGSAESALSGRAWCVCGLLKIKDRFCFLSARGMGVKGESWLFWVTLFFSLRYKRWVKCVVRAACCKYFPGVFLDQSSSEYLSI